MKITILSIFAMATIIGCQNNNGSNEIETEEVSAEVQGIETPENEEKELFNGENLDGWKIHGTEKWYVEDGLLVSESGPDKEYGYLATDGDYKNFELELEFLQVADGNSGVFIRSSLNGTKIKGWQVEVAPPGNDTGGIYESYGRGWLEQIPDEKEDILKPNEWNHLRVRAVGDSITTWLNGQKMIGMTDDKIGEAEGSVALQIHSGGGIKIRWKDINIKEIQGE